MAVQLGQVLVESGVLTASQVEAILGAQQQTRRPFGALAEEMFNVAPEVVEDAWASQYAEIAEHVDPSREKIDRAVLGLIDRRQAWQFRMLPLRHDGSEIRVVTTQAHLLRAMRFALRHFGQVCYFVLTAPEQLSQSLTEHYPLPGAEVNAVMRKDPMPRSPAN